MKDSNLEIARLFDEKSDLERQLEELHFQGYPEIKEIAGKKYIYLRYKKYDRLSSTYVGLYSETLFRDLKDLSITVRGLRGKLRSINTNLAKLGVHVDDFSPNVLLNIDFVRANLNTIIYGQAIVEGVSATFLDTQEILERGSCKNVSFDDTLTILNLKNAWQYALDEETIRRGPNFYTLCNIAGFVNDRQISYPDQLRTTRVFIGGSDYRPKIPVKEEVIRELDAMMNRDGSELHTAIDLLCFVAKNQLFTNGNKRTALVFANLYLLTKGIGFLSIPDALDREYKTLLVEYYEGKNEKVKAFLADQCFNALK